MTKHVIFHSSVILNQKISRHSNEEKYVMLARGMQCHFNFKVIKVQNFKVEMQCFKAILISLQNSVLVGNKLGPQMSGK